MKKIKIALYVVSVVAIGYFLFRFRDNLSTLQNLSFMESFLLILLVATIMLFQAGQFLGITHFFNKNIRFIDMVSITSISTMYNYILPASGGMAVRGVLLKNKFNISWGSVAAVMGAYHIACYAGMALLLLIAATIVYSLGHLALGLYATVIAFFVLLVAGVILIYTSNFRLPGSNRIVGFLNQMIDGIHQLKNDYSRHYRTIGYQIITVFISSLKLYLCFEFLEIPVSFWKVFLVQSFIVLSLVFSLTPGNIGIQEGIIIAFAGFLGLSPENVLVGSILDRVTNLITVLIMGIAGKAWLLK